MERAREGGGPTLIEAQTYRMGAHSTADDPSAYRSDEEEERWKRLDPQVRLIRHARWRGLWDEEQEREANERWDERISALVKECEVWPPPPLESLFEGITEEPTPQLAAQRDAYLRYWNARAGETSEVP